MARQEDDRQGDALPLQGRLQLEAGRARHPDVEEHAAGPVGERVQEEVAGRRVALRLEACGAEQPEESGAEGLVVVDDVDQRVKRS